jgi:hypothetical protein
VRQQINVLALATEAMRKLIGSMLFVMAVPKAITDTVAGISFNLF